jgi:ABC-type transporter Mla MlaB component
MLRIHRSEDQKSANFALSGRIEESHVSELQNLLAAETQAEEITLDLEEVKLVDRHGIKFLAACQARGIKLRNCPAYVREWIATRNDINRES